MNCENVDIVELESSCYDSIDDNIVGEMVYIWELLGLVIGGVVNFYCGVM